MKYKTNKRFYVFYDKNDFVKYFGTADDLVKDGYFPTKKAVQSRASKVKSGRLRGKVVVLPLKDKE